MVANGDSGIGNEIAVQVRLATGKIFSFQTILGSTTVREFKVLLEQNSNISADQQQLIYKGQVLKDDQTLESYGLQADHTVHIVRRLPALSTNTSGAANSGAPVTRYEEIRERMPRHGHVRCFRHSPRSIVPEFPASISRIEHIEELLRIQNQQAEIEMRTHNYRAQNNQNVSQHINLERVQQRLQLLHRAHRQLQLLSRECEQQYHQRREHRRRLQQINESEQQYHQQLIEELEGAPRRGHISDTGLSSDTPSSD